LWTIPTWDKGCLTLQPLVEKIKDFSNLIGGKQGFICWAFMLEANKLQTTYMAILSVNLALRICQVEDSLFAVLMKIQTFFERIFFSFQTFISSVFYKFNGFLPCLLELSLFKVCSH
jgi:hypothetical protein